MVRFEEDKLVIELPAVGKNDSIEKWTNLHHALCLILCDVSLSQEGVDLTQGYYYLFDFFEKLIPDWDDVIKMVK